MEKKKNIWSWLDGKKRVIGMGLILVSKVVALAGAPAVAEVVEYAGMIIGGVGMAHKGVKSRKTKDNR